MNDLISDNLLEPLIWTVVPYAWFIDDGNPRTYGFGCPLISFTIKEMAQEWARERSIEDFKSVGSEENFGDYVCPSSPNFVFYLLKEDMEDFCDKWKIDIDTFSIKLEVLNKMTDDDIITLMKELGLTFYKVYPVKIVC